MIADPKITKSSFYCASCKQDKPIDQVGKKIWANGSYFVPRCKTCAANKAGGDLEAIKAVPDEIDAPVNFEHGYCKCGNIDGLVDGKCQVCIEASESRRNKAVKRATETARPALETREDRLAFMSIFGEASAKNLALR